MPRKKKLLRVLLITIGIFFLILFGIFIYLLFVAVDHPPKLEGNENAYVNLQRKEVTPGIYIIGNNWIRRNQYGLYEMYVEGQPFERGVIAGKLSKELVVRQEEHFNEQINKLIPSKFYLHFLKYFIAWFNRDLDDNITGEYKKEIYGISLSASDKYSYIGSNYQRLLNYHAAHDIGHALQSLALVGCTSFGTWASRSQDSSLIIGRNFDFYVGDKFAEEKIVSFVNPDKGHKFMFVTWGGFAGVVSGMNEKGLTLTLNAAKTEIPSGAATPVSLVGREILQYASNISEAVAIARKRKMFVSESFLIGSATDHKAVIIEKTPDSLSVYDPENNYITCTNHFQSAALAKSEMNLQQVDGSASPYRAKRLLQLLDKDKKNTVQQTINILRDYKGIDDKDIGLGNEKAINEFLAHHSIVFEPEKLLVWVSTQPWQFGPFIAYDLRKIFKTHSPGSHDQITVPELYVEADSFIYSPRFESFMKFRLYRQLASENKIVDLDSLVLSNPAFYFTYVIAGDYSFRKKRWGEAKKYYEDALTKEIATAKERDYINSQISMCNKYLN